LHGFKETGGSVELLVISEIDRRSFRAMFRAKRGLKPGATIKIFSDSGDGCFILKCRSVDSQGYAVIDIENTEIVNLLQRAGKMPVPPYIKRNDSRFDAMDSERYQTVYARIPGSVAAPTAGLHFTERILSALRKKGVKIVRVCLHVGPGTFKPVRNNDVRKHNIDGEYFSIDSDTAAILNEAISRKKPVAAVGTTTVRTLESAYWDGAIQPGNGISDLFIFPGYKFRVVNRMITNFHLPQSSLLLLVSAFTGREKILSAYREAIEKKYRFYSYGDCMLII
jgi:S-adenosylmethionine:tRNA ribosyltransferase-isomerase